jgi:hypothetical protein
VFKRVIWMGSGMAVGAGSAFWAKRKVRATVERYLPDEVARRAGEQARSIGRSVRDAATEGRLAMRQREAELRAELESRPSGGSRARSRAGAALAPPPVAAAPAALALRRAAGGAAAAPGGPRSRAERQRAH